MDNLKAWGVSVQMCAESENYHFSHIFFQHGYLTYYSTYLLKNFLKKMQKNAKVTRFSS